MSLSSTTLQPLGFGLRPGHMDDVLQKRPQTGFVEAHSENFFGGGPLRRKLHQAREHYDISLHGVGLSLGRADGLDQTHLQSLKALVDDIDPIRVSEHLSWSSYSHTSVPDLLPVPFTNEAFGIFCNHVDEMQTVLGRQVLIENPSNYLAFAQTDMDEPTFLNNLCQKTGCGLLLDINNIYVTAHNLNRSATEYIDAINPSYVQQYHLAGYEEVPTEQEVLYIDTHGEPVHDEVWKGYSYTLNTIGDRPTLLEWDTNLPPLERLLEEVENIAVVRGKTLNTEEAA